MDAHEERDIATFDIPGAYLHAEMPSDKNVILKLRGHFVDIMCDINGEYRQYVRYEQGKKVLYLKVQRKYTAVLNRHCNGTICTLKL